VLGFLASCKIQGVFVVIKKLTMNYLVSPPDKTHWNLDTADFLSRLIEQWPSARVRRNNDLNFTPSWKMEMPGGTLEGEFNPRCSGIALDGDLEDCATFALWFRSLVPAMQPLLFYDDCFNVDVPLTPETTAADLIAAFQ